MSHLLIQGDARRIPLANRSVHCVVTSPPYWGLRDYGTATWKGGDSDCDHVAKQPTKRAFVNGRGEAGTTSCQSWSDRDVSTVYRDTCGKCGARRINAQIGLEATPDEYVASTVSVFREVKRILRDDGTCWVNLGDSYAGGGNGGGGSFESERHGWSVHGRNNRHGLKPKDLIGMPWRVALALQHDGWYLRSDIIWAKPNPMPESVTDRPTKSHEYLFLLAKQERYYFDADAVRQDWADEREGAPGGKRPAERNRGGRTDGYTTPPLTWVHPEGRTGRNIRSVWSIATESYPGAHFATFPRKLVEPCIKAGTSDCGACPQCGAPWERVTDVVPAPEPFRNGTDYVDHIHEVNPSKKKSRLHGLIKGATLGWRPICSCFGHFETIEPDPEDEYARPIRVYIPDGPQPEPVPCIIFDPFIGSGTTIVVANALERHGIGCDLSADYLAQARRRVERPHQPRTKPAKQEAFTLKGLS